MSPVHVAGQLRQARLDSKQAEQGDTERLSQQQTGENAQAVRCGQVFDPVTREYNPDVGQSKERHDDKSYRPVEEMFHVPRD